MKILNIINQLPRKGQIGIRDLKTLSYIIVHHDAVAEPKAYDPVDLYKREAQFHINNKNTDGLQYHYRIDKKGNVYQTRDLKDILYHCSNYKINLISIAVCLDGNFENIEKPTKEALIALNELLLFLMGKFKIKKDNIFGHREVALPGYGTACPGNNLLPYIQKIRKEGIKPKPEAKAKPTENEIKEFINFIEKFKEIAKEIFSKYFK